MCHPAVKKNSLKKKSEWIKAGGVGGVSFSVKGGEIKMSLEAWWGWGRSLITAKSVEEKEGRVEEGDPVLVLCDGAPADSLVLRRCV